MNRLDRRRFLVGTLAAGAWLGCGNGKPTPRTAEPPAEPVVQAPPDAAPEKTGKSILILGGTGFLGPHIVEYARSRGHTLTLFNRGKTRPHLFPDVEKLQGDRDGKLGALEGRKWDAVVDTSGYVPRVVKMSAELLAPNVQHYLFISTISVYAKNDVVGQTEDAPLAELTEPGSEEVMKHYGALKALCEVEARKAFPDGAHVIRPGLIVGPGDPTGRFTHWPHRMKQGGEVLCPGDGTTPTQWIDGRDLAQWIVHSIEQRLTGTHNALGPLPGTPMKEVLETCNQAAGGASTLTWVDAAFLEKQGVAPWQDLPMWIPAEGEYAGFGMTSNERAVAAGLTFRPLIDTARDTLAWLETPDLPPNFATSGIDREREAKVLAAWKDRDKKPQTKRKKRG